MNLPDPAGGDRELVLDDGRPIRYEGRVDLLAGDEHDRYWVVAHRVVDRFGPADDLLLDEELVAAGWAMERFYPGMRIAGTIHNELLRPAEPPAGVDQPAPAAAPWRARRRRLRRHQRGLPQHEASGGGRSLPYARRGLGPRPADPAVVSSEGDGEFRRTRILRDPAELAAVGARLAAEALDMVDPELRLYPQPGPRALPRLPVRGPVCGRRARRRPRRARGGLPRPRPGAGRAGPPRQRDLGHGPRRGPAQVGPD